MPPRKNPLSRGNGKLGAAGVPLVSGDYMELLRDFRRDEAKRRRVEQSERPTAQIATARLSSPDVGSPRTDSLPSSQSSSLAPPLPTLMSEESDSDMDSDDFEDVELDHDNNEDGTQSDSMGQDIVVSLDASQAARTINRSPKEKGPPKWFRLALHKISLMTWMVHTGMRYKWLSSPTVLRSATFRHILPEAVKNELCPPGHLTPFLKSKKLIDGLRHAVEVWQRRFRVMGPGLASSGDSRGDPGSKDEYTARLLALQGSQDMLGQGFVSLVKSMGLRARLVCSLQPPDNLVSANKAQGKNSKIASERPIFWAEVWDEWAPGWIAVDPVTTTVRLPTRSKVKTAIEPPLSDRFNVLRYCVAFSKSTVARDVTRRYASNFNARTRKRRLPHFEGEEWLDKLFALYAPHPYTREDVAEIKELERYPRLEGIPTRVQDFAGHPQYALSEQLHRNEVLRPGAQACGTLANKGKPVSYIYRRQDVLTARSGQSWYRRGRAIRTGAQPRAERRMKNRLSGELETTGLYTEDQTELYHAQPVSEDGTVPKSEYRTIDIFTPNMIPAGGVYIKSKYGTPAAKVLKIDFANVVTGVDYDKRGPHSRMFGVVVADMYKPAMDAVIDGFQAQEQEEAERAEDLRIMTLWRKLIVGIQIWNRVERMNPQVRDESEKEDSSTEETQESAEEAAREIVHTGAGPREPNTARPAMPKASATPSTAQTTRRLQQTPIRLNVDLLSSSDSDGIEITGSRSVVDNSRPVSGQTIPEQKSDSSPGSYHSFSDIDVDEISESEL